MVPPIWSIRRSLSGLDRVRRPRPRPPTRSSGGKAERRSCPPPRLEVRATPLYNTLLLDGTHAAGSYQFNVDAAGKLTLTDTSTTDATAGQSMTVTGDSYIVFNGGAASTTAGVYDSLFIIATTENNAEIARMYQSTFGRLPDLPGYEAWTLAVNTGLITMHQAAEAFISSGEFTAHYGAQGAMTDLQYVTAMYANVLGRTPDQSGLTAWTTYLTGLEATNGGTAAGNLDARGTVLQDFAVSQEEVNHSSTWLIDTGNGGYADASTPIAAITALNIAVTTGVLNTGVIAPTTSLIEFIELFDHRFQRDWISGDGVRIGPRFWLRHS